MTTVTPPWGDACDDCRQSTAGHCWRHAWDVTLPMSWGTGSSSWTTYNQTVTLS